MDKFWKKYNFLGELYIFWKDSRGGGGKSLKKNWLTWMKNGWCLKRSILFQGYINTHMYIFGISWSSCSQNPPKKLSLLRGGIAKFLAPGIFMLTSLFLGWNNPIHWVLLKFQSEWCSTWVISQRIPHYYQEISGNFEIYFLFHLWYFLGFFGSVIPFVIFLF